VQIAGKKVSKSKADRSDDARKTTVMFRNIPNNYTREMLLELLDVQGFKGCYDFVYWPMDSKKMAGLGYAFINLTSPINAVHFKEYFDGFTDWELSSKKVGEVSWSQPLQGLKAHIARYRNCPMMHEDVPDEFRPMLFSEGVRIAFPPPTEEVQKPRWLK
jgi:hypothetical protein